MLLQCYKLLVLCEMVAKWFGNDQVGTYDFNGIHKVNVDSYKRYGFTFTIPYDQCKKLKIVSLGLYSPKDQYDCGEYEISVWDTQDGEKLGTRLLPSVFRFLDSVCTCPVNHL